MKKLLFALLPLAFMTFSLKSNAISYCWYSQQTSIDSWSIFIDIVDDGQYTPYQPYVRYTVTQWGMSFTTNWEPLSGSAFLTTGVGTGLGYSVSNIEIQMYTIPLNGGPSNPVGSPFLVPHC